MSGQEGPFCASLQKISGLLIEDQQMTFVVASHRIPQQKIQQRYGDILSWM